MSRPSRTLPALPGIVSLAVFVVIVRAVLSIPPTGQGLATQVSQAADSIGFKNRVTAVLLDFRGYDTLLEVAVLMLATVTVLSLREEPCVLRRPISRRATAVLATLNKGLVPLAVIAAVHLVWIGASQPGGAFQAGAVLGAASILLALSGFARPRWVGRGAMRATLAVGVLTFLAISLLAIYAGGDLLQYPDGARKTLILVIELLLTLSIGVSLAILFLSSASAEDGVDR